eukprot:4096052-Amphidinium_carterae.1
MQKPHSCRLWCQGRKASHDEVQQVMLRGHKHNCIDPRNDNKELQSMQGAEYIDTRSTWAVDNLGFVLSTCRLEGVGNGSTMT